jgi:hypothetical protein
LSHDEGRIAAMEDSQRPEINLKDPLLAAFLAWLLPGLGHAYQGRYAKAILFFVFIVGTFIFGVYLGSSGEVGVGRVVYASWREEDRRFSYLAQVCVGLPALPALVQANRVHNGKEPLWHGFMAPPQLDPDQNAQNPPGLANEPTLSALHKNLNRFFELGTLYTVVAGLLNVLAIYDAWEGPAFPEPQQNEEEDEEKENPGGEGSA